MKTKLNLFVLAFVLLTLSVGGKSNIIIEPVESHESLHLTPVEIDYEQAPVAFLEQDSNAEIILAENNCGNENCSDKECCCLNVESGAQCCRPRGNSANCIEACKKSKPC